MERSHLDSLRNRAHPPAFSENSGPQLPRDSTRCTGSINLCVSASLFGCARLPFPFLAAFRPQGENFPCVRFRAELGTGRAIPVRSQLNPLNGHPISPCFQGPLSGNNMLGEVAFPLSGLDLLLNYQMCLSFFWGEPFLEWF